MFEAKEDLVKSLEAVTIAAEELLAAMEAQIGVGKAQDKVRFDQPQEYTSSVEMSERLHKMLTALYFLLQSESVIDDAHVIIINEANLILQDAKQSITNEKDLSGVFAIREKIAAINTTTIELVALNP